MTSISLRQNHMSQDRLSRRSLLKRGAGAVALISGLGAALPVTQRVMAQAGDYELVCQYDGVRVRSTPSLSGAVVGVVNTGGVVSVTGETVIADGYSWMPVFVHGSNINGHVASEFFSHSDGSTGWFRGTPAHVTSDGVNLRSGPGVGHSVIAAYNTGTNGVIQDGPRSADGYSWYNLDIDGRNGWMAADFLAEGHSGGPGPSPSPGQFQIGAYVRPTDSLNLRSGAGTGSGVIRVISGQDIATVIGGPQAADGYSWYQVEMWDQAATVGWVAGDFLELARFEPTGARHQVADGPLNVRSGGGLASPVIATIPTGGVFVIKDASMVSADGYTWAWVELESNPSVTGWVALGFSVEI
jgi:uncharacterized protein YgiM (DUF1202 family)